MAKALREGGLYYTDKGVAVDAQGEKVKDAPKQPKDTDPSLQPGATGALTSEERLGVAIATAMKGGVKASKGQGTSGQTPDPDEDETLPPIKDLAEHVSGLKTVEEVQALAKRDDRKSAEKIYDARIAELESK